MPLPDITADKLILPSEITIDNVKGLKILEPFGEGSRQLYSPWRNLSSRNRAVVQGITYQAAPCLRGKKI